MGEHVLARSFVASLRFALGLASSSKTQLARAREERIPTCIATIARRRRGCRPGASVCRCSTRSLLGDLVSVEIELEPCSLCAGQNQLVSLPREDPQGAGARRSSEGS